MKRFNVSDIEAWAYDEIERRFKIILKDGLSTMMSIEESEDVIKEIVTNFADGKKAEITLVDDMVKTNDSYKEIFRLEQMLLADNIPYQLRENFDGWQIGYPELPPQPSSKCVCSIVQHFGSYGSQDDLLEIKGLTQNGDEVEGWLQAEDVFNRISAHYKGCVTKQWVL